MLIKRLIKVRLPVDQAYFQFCFVLYLDLHICALKYVYYVALLQNLLDLIQHFLQEYMELIPELLHNDEHSKNQFQKFLLNKIKAFRILPFQHKLLLERGIFF